MNETDARVDVITDDDVRTELIEFYGRARGKNEAVQDADLVATEIRNEMYGPQGWMFTLTGMPSRGFALYFPDDQAVYFYDFWGNKHNECFYTDIEGYVDDIDP